ncbi:unnamed protein product [Brassica rapa subsp. trilocularis]
MILSEMAVLRLNCRGCCVLMVVMIKVLVVEEAVRCYSCWIDIYIYCRDSTNFNQILLYVDAKDS